MTTYIIILVHFFSFLINLFLIAEAVELPLLSGAGGGVLGGQWDHHTFLLSFRKENQNYNITELPCNRFFVTFFHKTLNRN